MSNLNREESTVVSYRGGDTARLEAKVTAGSDLVSLSLQTVETSVAFTASRASLRELSTFLAEVVSDLEAVPAPEPVEEPSTELVALPLLGDDQA